MTIIVRHIFVLILLMPSQGFGSLYDPHLFPSIGPFFEGWYMRIVDFDSNDSLGLLFGHVLPKSTQNVTGPLIVASILRRTCVQTTGCQLTSINGAFEPEDLKVTVHDDPVTTDPDQNSPPDFKWTVSSSKHGGYFEQNGETTSFNFELGEITFRGEATNPVPWNSGGTGPEGWLVYLPLPLHWFVYSLRSELTYYELQNTTSGSVVSGTNGAVHLEKNWGNSFPKRWIWSEGISSSNNATFAISGGLVDFKLFSVDAYLIGIRDPHTSLDLDFRPDNSMVSTNMDGCGGEVNITVNSVSYHVDINISAKTSSYSKCLLGPEVGGFRPACVESYDAIATMVVSERSLIPFLYTNERTYTFPMATLEFGGSHVCNETCV